MVNNATSVTWDAQEYVVRDKNAGWYVGLVIAGLILVALAVLTQSWTAVALVVVSILGLIIYSVRPPRTLHYKLDKDGLTEGEKKYAYSDFKAFGVAHEGQHFSIVLIPKKRFGVRVTVYFPEAQGEQIVDMFGARLPMEPVKSDFLDKLIKFLRI